MATSINKSNNGVLAWIEKVGNKMPHPLMLFIYIILGTMGISFILSLFNVMVTHPSTGIDIYVKNLISLETLVGMTSNFANNVFTFPVLTNVLILATASGLCEKTGFFTTAIRMALKNAKGNMVVFVIAYVAVHGSIAGDVAFLLIPTIAGVIFYNLKRNPLVGIFLAYACVGGGYGVAFFLIPGLGWDVTLTPITNAAAHLIDSGFSLNYVSGHYLLSVAALFIALMATFVTVKFVEPRFGEYTGVPEGLDENAGEITKEEENAVKKAILGLGVFAVLVIALCIPENSLFRGEGGSLITKSPLLGSMLFWTFAVFFIPGFIYGYLTKKFQTVSELSTILSAAAAQVSGFVVLVIVIAQFLYLFSVSNIGTVLAISGGNFLQAIDAPPIVIFLAFLFLVAFINLFIISGSAKYVLFAPIFVPMFMQLDLHPAMTQVVYRMGDGLTNHLSPLNAFFAILLTLVHKYDKKVGMGTIFSVMIPYTIGFTIVYSALIVIWFVFNLPPGIGTTIYMN